MTVSRSAESAVGAVQTRILLALRHETFFSLDAMNAAIGRELDRLNEAPMASGETRRAVFETTERTALQALPANPWEWGEWVERKVALNGHVRVEHNHYSVPDGHIGRGVAARVGERILHVEGPMPKRSELRLTKRSVALTVQAKDTVFWDRDLAGFGVRVHATGRKAYVVQSRGPGGLKRVTLGHHGDMATDEARKRAATVIDRIKRGEPPVSAPPAPELTVAAFAERYMRAHVLVRCKSSTAGTYRLVLDRHILPVLGETPVGAVGRSDIAALHHRLRTTPTMANAAVDILSKMFNLKHRLRFSST